MLRHSSKSVIAAGFLAASIGLCGSAVALASSGTHAAASLPPCRTADLSARLEPGSPGAGQRYATLVLINRSTHTCHTFGYVGMLLLDRSGRALATSVIRNSAPRPHRVVISPDGHAASLLHWTVVPGRGDRTAPCARAPRAVEITPPDEFSHLVIPWRAGPVCQRGRIDVTALVPAR